MGANVYLTGVKSWGTAGEGGGSVLQLGMPGKSGSRIAVKAFALYGGATAQDFYFMQVLGMDSAEVAMASGGSILKLTAQPDSSRDLASDDWLAIVQDDGVYHFTKLGNIVTGFSILVLCTVVTDSVAIGNAVYDFGAYGDAGHHKIPMTASTEVERKLDGGFIYGQGLGYPMMLYNVNDMTAAQVVRYLSIDYINK